MLFGRRKQKEEGTEESLIRQIDQWYQAGEYQKIVEAVLDLPAERRSYQLMGELAVAYNNLQEYDEAAKVLRQVEKEGQKDPKWYYRLGYACYYRGNKEEAKALLEKAVELAPENEGFRELLELCQTSLEGEQVSPDSPEYLVRDLASSLGKAAQLKEGALYLKDWRVTIRAEVDSIKEQMVSLYYYLSCPDWDRELFECSAALGKDWRQAMGMAQGSFLFGMMSGIQEMMEGAEADRLKTQYAGRVHCWKVYQSNVVGMGNSPGNTGNRLWELLREEIGKRIGNQKLCYVKVYGAKNGDNITGECRINDINIPALGELVADYVRQWEIEGFGSQKQFFFLKQEEETYIPYPHTEKQLTEYTHKAAQMFHEMMQACESEEEYEQFEEKLAEMTGDKDLATELFLFLPEICAENAFSKLRFPETLLLQRAGEEPFQIYKTQHAAYHTIGKAFFQGLDTGVFAGYENEVYREYIAVSAVYSCLQNAQEQGKEISEELSIATCCQVSEDYQLR